MGVPRLYPDMRVELVGGARQLGGAARARLFVRHFAPASETRLFFGPSLDLKSEEACTLTLTVPDADGWPVKDLGIEISGDRGVAGTFLIDRVGFSGPFSFRLPDLFPFTPKWAPIGWVADVDTFGWPLSDEPEVLRSTSARTKDAASWSLATPIGPTTASPVAWLPISPNVRVSSLATRA